jgi:hypothetical protein
MYTAGLEIDYSWSDTRLVTEDLVTNLANVDAITDNLWKPQISLTNLHESKFSKEHIYIRRDKTVVQKLDTVVELACNYDFETMPFDEQKCEIVMQSTLHDITELVFDTKHSRFDINDDIINVEWDITSHEIKFDTHDEVGK